MADEIKGYPGVAAVSEPAQNETGDITVVSVTPASGPAADETKDLVSYMRGQAEEISAKYGIDAYVTGTTALNIDTNDKLAAALPKYIAVVVGLALILLTVVFRSVLVPVKAVGGFLLSIAASLGLVVWVFQDGNLMGLFDIAKAGPITSFLPVLLVGILFGLAMDYQGFLVSRMREHFRALRAREGVGRGRLRPERPGRHGGGDHHDLRLRGVHPGHGSGREVDRPVARVRSTRRRVRGPQTVVSAVMTLLGRKAWWMPKRLERIVPELDIEGEAIMKGARLSS